jgi:hypothetical protein
MQHRSTFRSYELRPLLDYARTEGINLDELLARFGLSPELENRPHVEVALESGNGLANAIASELGDPFLGIHVAIRFQRGAFQLIEFACRSAPDLNHRARS